jgi:hypothetical protein
VDNKTNTARQVSGPFEFETISGRLLLYKTKAKGNIQAINQREEPTARLQNAQRAYSHAEPD